jgi:ABC-type molybdate transport system substrate-binding protein
MSEKLAIDCDCIVSWYDPVDLVDNSLVDDATGYVTVRDSSGNAVTGAETLTITYDAGPPRRYYATIPSTITLTENAAYYVEFSLTDDDGTPIGFRRKRFIAEYAE